MTKYKVYPEGYDPIKTSGPPGEDMKRLGIDWTPEDTEHARQLEKQFVISDVKIFMRWYEEYDEDEIEEITVDYQI